MAGVHETELPIDLPDGARVIGVALRRDDGAVWGRAVRADRGQGLFHDAEVAALVEGAGTSGDVEHLLLRVAASAIDGPTEVTLGIELPQVSSITIETRTTLVIDGKQRFARATVVVAPEALADDIVHVDAKTSLLAETLSRREPVVSLGDVHQPSSCGTSHIRRSCDATSPHFGIAHARRPGPARSRGRGGDALLHSPGWQRDRSFGHWRRSGGFVGRTLSRERGRHVGFPETSETGVTRLNYPFEFKLNR